MEPIEYEGLWWLPEKPGDQVCGTLTYDPQDGAVLKLIGLFEAEGVFDASLRPEIILGIVNRNLVTLYKCIQTEAGFNMPGIATSQFQALVVLLGEHFSRAENIKFDRISVRYPGLEEWVGLRAFNFDRIPDDNRLLRCTIEYTQPEPIRAPLGDAMISFIPILHFSPSRFTGANINQSVLLEIKPSSPLHLEEYFKDPLYHMRNFFALAMGRPVYPISITGYIDRPEKSEEPSKIDIFYQVGAGSQRKVGGPPRMFFTRQDIGPNLAVYIQNWLEKADLLKPVYDLYFGVMYNSYEYLDMQFLNLVHAVETYHRRVICNQVMPEEQHQEKVARILAKVGEEDRSWLEEKLMYSNEPTLRQRLREILKLSPQLVMKAIGNFKSFIKKVVDTRNYLTHYDQSLEGQAARGEELYHLTQRLKMVLQTCLLRELGFPPEKIEELLAHADEWNIETESASNQKS